jgi:hypothetical protein
MLATATVLAAWFTPRLVVAALALPTAGLWLYGAWYGHLAALPPAGLLILLALLARSDVRPPRSWLWLAGLLVALTLIPPVLDQAGGAFISQLVTLSDFAPLIPPAVAIAWSIVDARLLVAMAAFVLFATLGLFLAGAAAWGSEVLVIALVPLALTVVLAMAGVWRLRRRQAPLIRPRA